MSDTLIYRALRWLNEHGRQGLVVGMLWRWRASAEDRTRLKQRVRALEASQAPPRPAEGTLPGPHLHAAMLRVGVSVCPLCGEETEQQIRPAVRLAQDPELAAKGWTEQDELDQRQRCCPGELGSADWWKR